MGNMSIELNNYAITELEENGNITKAYELLVFSCSKIRSRRIHEHDIDMIDSEEYFRFTWKDCTGIINKKIHEEWVSARDDISSTAFMYLRFLSIDIPGHTGKRKPLYSPTCPCGYAWAVWYNLGIVSALLASLKQHPEDRRRLLEQALEMLSRAESRVDKEPPSKHWSLLNLSILNNQACVLRDLSLDDYILERLVCMGLALTKNISILNDSDQEPFVWTIQLLMQDKYAPAA